MIQTCQHYGIPIDIPFQELDEDDRDILLNGSGSTPINFQFTSQKGGSYRMNKPWGGSFLKAKEDLHGHIIRQNEVKALVIHD